jgi:hypothetical protein
VNVTTVWQSDGHCLTFCFQRFEFTACSSRSIELHVMSALLPKADMRSAPTHVRFGPKADIYATEILGLLHPRLAQAFDEFCHPAGV